MSGSRAPISFAPPRVLAPARSRVAQHRHHDDARRGFVRRPSVPGRLSGQGVGIGQHGVAPGPHDLAHRVRPALGKAEGAPADGGGDEIGPPTTVVCARFVHGRQRDGQPARRMAQARRVGAQTCGGVVHRQQAPFHPHFAFVQGVLDGWRRFQEVATAQIQRPEHLVQARAFHHRRQRHARVGGGRGIPDGVLEVAHGLDQQQHRENLGFLQRNSVDVFHRNRRHLAPQLRVGCQASAVERLVRQQSDDGWQRAASLRVRERIGTLHGFEEANDIIEVRHGRSPGNFTTGPIVGPTRLERVARATRRYSRLCVIWASAAAIRPARVSSRQ